MIAACHAPIRERAGTKHPMKAKSSVRTAGLIWVSLTLVAGCATNEPYEINLMPIPAAYTGMDQSGSSTPNYLVTSPFQGILYVTDRAPPGEGDAERYYLGERGSSLRVGAAQVGYSGEPKTEEELRDIALAKSRRMEFPLAVSELEEFGVLNSALPYGELTTADELGDAQFADDRFAGLVNKKLAVSRDKDVYIYVHGYKVVFEYPVLVSAQLWHFMGYDGVFIPFAWPSTPKRLAYFKDLETAEISARNLRLFIEFLLERTDAEKVHIIGYSAGSRVVIAALHQLALMQSNQPDASTGIGQVVLVASDYDRQRWAAAVADGLLRVSDRQTVYVSSQDKALNLSSLLLRVGRLGQPESDEAISDRVMDWIRTNDDLYFVDVSGVEGTDVGNGHAYFESSPWVSSDLLATLQYELTPEARGLVREPMAPSWTFPENYDAKLRQAIGEQHYNRTGEMPERSTE